MANSELFSIICSNVKSSFSKKTVAANRHHGIDDNRLIVMKAGRVIVNTAEGDLIGKQALVEALDFGSSDASGLDVPHNKWACNWSTAHCWNTPGPTII